MAETMSKPMNWDKQTRQNKAKSFRRRSLKAAVEYRRRQIAAEPEPEPHGLNLTDSRGRPITLPRVSILERGEVDPDPLRSIRVRAKEAVPS